MVVVSCVILKITHTPANPEATIPKIEITKSSLQKVINISELNTLSIGYSGVAEVRNEKNNEKVDFYVSYDAKIHAGINTDKIGISINDEMKMIYISVPDATITEISIDENSLRPMFKNNKHNELGASKRAEEAAEMDIQSEIDEATICELAKENTINIIKASVTPFLAELDTDYGLLVA